MMVMQLTMNGYKMKITNKESSEYTSKELDFIYKTSLKNGFIGDFFEFTTSKELINKCNLLLTNKDFLNEKAKECYENAQKYFMPEPIAKYFLSKIF